MDIHKPKPWHGLREFLKEYVIIVVGVLTALGAEQAVEAVHTAHKASEAEGLVREEMSVNLAFARDRARFSPCYQAHLVAAQRLLLASAKEGRIGSLPRLVVGSRPFAWAQWQAAVASGIAGHFPSERRLVYQRLYLTGAADGGESLNARQNIVTEDGARLATLVLPPRSIDIGTREQLLQAARVANYEERLIEGQARHFIELASPLHLPPAKFSAGVVLHTDEDTRACLADVAAETAGLPSVPVSLPAAWSH